MGAGVDGALGQPVQYVVEAVYSPGQEVVIIPHLLLVGKNVLDLAVILEIATQVYVQVGRRYFSCLTEQLV